MTEHFDERNILYMSSYTGVANLQIVINSPILAHPVQVIKPHCLGSTRVTKRAYWHVVAMRYGCDFVFFKWVSYGVLGGMNAFNAI